MEAPHSPLHSGWIMDIRGSRGDLLFSAQATLGQLGISSAILWDGGKGGGKG